MTEEEGIRPIFRRYWCKVLPNDQCIAQFDDDGNYITWRDEIPAKKVMFIPFSREFAAKVLDKGDIAIPSNLPIIEFDVKDKVKYHRHCTYSQKVYNTCRFCEAILDINAISCPRCFGTSYYYCDQCDEMKLAPILKLEIQDPEKNTEMINIPISFLKSAGSIVKNIPGNFTLKNSWILCPDCKEPRGLSGVSCITESADQAVSFVHILEVDDEKHFILEYKK